MNRLVLAAAALAVLGLIALVFGKRHARRLQHARRIRIDRFKLKRRHAEIELEVFGSREVVRAIQDYAREHRVTIDEARRQASQYLREIVPKFNLLAYYRVGAPLASAIMRFLYRVVVERKPIREFNERGMKGATVVYIINHRSNADYVLVAHMLFKFISLSYAIGEWARVWPLNHVFKWFGGYFVRRRYREPLYHAVLSKFVQTITKHGVTQGVFIEGGLSRDGAFQKPKLGMLDYLVTAKRDPEFTSPLFIIPTAVNYDRVLEDRTLTDELLGREERATKREKLATTFDYLFRNFFRGLFRRFKRYGYAMVTFGAPISVDAFLREHPAALSEEFEERKADLQALAELVMTEISDALPVTPVTLAATAFRRRHVLTERAMLAELTALREEWRGRPWLMREKTPLEIWNAAKFVLTLRHLIQPAAEWRDELFDGGDAGAPALEDAWMWNPSETTLRDYYANALVPFADVQQRGWPERPKKRSKP
ncbi:MAG: 1-acyl-sn-glycerol-3-phosphate acyltransferase [Acidobacteria bacterium]|nr:1-acyl-sn-glycerol-3-phosphate acyltransferase [Acidobacteriota bacterium]MBV9476626.1 1-acyl-sn-glycerol-3-phosphate acyltransferase [Acidobacteriota bacterium]